LLGILGNAKKYYEGAGDAADAPVLGEAPVATCIDFYGATRVAKYPKVLVYVSPRGQTAFNPDPIAILKNPPNPQLAQRFVDFVLSKQGQALWAVRPGEMGGPIRAALGRQPIRKDVYTEYADRMSPWVINPYEAGQSLKLDADLWDLSYGVLRQLVSAAAVKNADALGRAKKTLIERGFPDQLVAEFNRLPENIDSIDDLATLNERLTDQQQAEVIVTEWVNFFKRKYDRISQ
jgi:ABC-type glycerol-3-phosphate transport system substrate-binding protein